MRLTLPVVFALGATSCLSPTQVTLDIRTDVPCEEVSAVGISVGPAGDIEERPLTTTARTCSPGGTLNTIGTFAIAPEAGATEVSVRLILAERGVALESACTPQNQYRGCIVSRRTVRFLPRRGLVIPVDLFLVCKDVACEADSTCNRLGRCVSSTVDVGACEGNVCGATLRAPGVDEETPAPSSVRSTFVASPTVVAADGLSETTLTFTLRDGLRAPVAGEAVSLRATGAQNSFRTVSSVTDERGVFEARLASTLAGARRVFARSGALELETEVVFVRPGGGAGGGAAGGSAGGGAAGGTAGGAAGGTAGGSSGGGAGPWALSGEVVPLSRDAGDLFGAHLAFDQSGQTLVVGAPGESSIGVGVNSPVFGEAAPFSGAVFVFARLPDAGWVQEARIKASNTGPGDGFGAAQFITGVSDWLSAGPAVALSDDGTVLVVGAPFEDSAGVGSGAPGTDDSATDRGAAYVFSRSSGTWREVGFLKPPTPGPGHLFGASVATSADGLVVAVGAPGTPEVDGGAFKGSVALFARSIDGGYEFIDTLRAPGAASGDRFGTGLSMAERGSPIVVGAPGSSSGSPGRILVFERGGLGDGGAFSVFEVGDVPAGFSAGRRTLIDRAGNRLLTNRNPNLPALVARDGGTWQLEQVLMATLTTGPQPMALSRGGDLVLVREGATIVAVHAFDGQRWVPEAMFPQAPVLPMTGPVPAGAVAVSGNGRYAATMDPYATPGIVWVRTR